MKTPGVQNYFSALQDLFRLQSAVLTDVIPHAGERGRNDEQRFREFLERILPRKFSVGTGFVICSNPEISPSSQTDIVLYDDFHNSPLHRELTAHVYPVEIVYGTVEVKGLLQKKDLAKICEDIAKIRLLGHRRWYIDYGSREATPGDPHSKVVSKNEMVTGVPPRAFVFAYECKGWRSLADLIKTLETVMATTPAHLHGMAILDKDWYVAQVAHARNGPRFVSQEGGSLLRFMNGMLHSIGSVEMRQMSIDRYHEMFRT